ncbi:MAG: DUF2934 domain-containing protein [Porticoccaceae bacterium]
MNEGKKMVSNDSGADGAQREVPEPVGVSMQDRQQMIADAAYYRAQARGFGPGYDLEDWLQAEADIDCTLEGG